MRMLAYVKPLIIVLIGLGIASAGVQMSLARETHSYSTDTRGWHAAIGMGGGAASGVILWLVIGSVGVVTGGTGFAIGLPAMAGLGLCGGALAGAATGKLTSTHTISATYSPWAWVSVLVIGLVVAWYGMTRFHRIRTSHVPSTAFLQGR